MKLDSRILEGKKPLTCFDVEQAKEFLGKECYFSNCKGHYKNLSAFEKYVSLTDHCIGTLTAVMDLGDRVFDVDQRCNEFRYCLPCEWVKEPEKKYRPYKDVEEFFDDVGCTLGDVIRFRKKDSLEEEYHTVLTGFKGNARVNIGLGDGGYYSLSDLFSLFELYTSDGWKPFGIEE